MRQVKTVCPRDCPDSCFITTTVYEGRIVSIRGDPEHPVTRGFTCPLGVADKERVYAEERILYPHIAVDGGQIRERAAVVWVNPEHAEAMGARDGNLVSLKNELGTVGVRVKVTGRVPRGVLWSPRLLTGLSGVLQNALFSSSTREIGGGPVFNSTRVEIEAGDPEG